MSFCSWRCVRKNRDMCFVSAQDACRRQLSFQKKRSFQLSTVVIQVKEDYSLYIQAVLQHCWHLSRAFSMHYKYLDPSIRFIESQIHKHLYGKNLVQSTFLKGFYGNINSLLVKEVQFQPKQHLVFTWFALIRAYLFLCHYCLERTQPKYLWFCMKAVVGTSLIKESNKEYFIQM